MFLALSEFDNFLFEFDKISLLAVAAGSRGVAPSVLNVDSEEGGGSFSRVPVQQTQNRSKNVAFKRPKRTKINSLCFSPSISVVNQSMPLSQTRMGKTSIDPPDDN